MCLQLQKSQSLLSSRNYSTYPYDTVFLNLQWPFWPLPPWWKTRALVCAVISEQHILVSDATWYWCYHGNSSCNNKNIKNTSSLLFSLSLVYFLWVFYEFSLFSVFSLSPAVSLCLRVSVSLLKLWAPGAQRLRAVWSMPTELACLQHSPEPLAGSICIYQIC